LKFRADTVLRHWFKPSKIYQLFLHLLSFYAVAF